MVKCPLCDWPTDYNTKGGLMYHFKTKHRNLSKAEAKAVYEKLILRCPHCGVMRPVTNEVYCLSCGKMYKEVRGESVKSHKRKVKSRRRR